MERLIADRPDVLVSDIGMPEEDGSSLIRRVRASRQEQGGDTPAVALTAYARGEDRMNAVVAGFQHHVAKPVEPAELITMIASLARRRRLFLLAPADPQWSERKLGRTRKERPSATPWLALGLHARDALQATEIPVLPCSSKIKSTWTPPRPKS